MGLFGNYLKTKKIKLACPVDGYVIELKKVEDGVFSEGMLGLGFAVQPENGHIYSPVSGRITSIFPTKHAIGITYFNDIEVLVHMGVETVTLDGKPFDIFVEEGQKVNIGDHLANVDLKELEKKKIQDTIIVVVTNTNTAKSISKISEKFSKSGEIIATVNF
ncbi:PTS sugar transporter subunit IIA [Pediococcus acidilactici]|uniref:PTS sugar transporter subunit IIA n=1 Tax=Pediococcus acidilactici TaxID=1254 RepID=UPI00194E072B|nr:PTS glucose transporter subunit IIA [Pediococcus acidilactici]MBM6585012.1 PTS glucose transporter subunit IIA [Pediococcus acidilactici]